MERIIEEESKREKERAIKINKAQNSLFEYFYNRDFVLLLGFLYVYIFLQILQILESYHWLALIRCILSVCIIIGLSCFYHEVKYNDSSNKSLGYTATVLNIYNVATIILSVITILVFIPIMFKALILFITTIILIFILIVNIQALYYTASSLTVIRNFIDYGCLEGQYSFKKGSSKWIFIGLLNIITILFALFYQQYDTLTNQQIGSKTLLSLGGLSKPLNIIVIIMSIIYPFVLSMTLDNTKRGLERIFDEVNADTKEDVV